MGKASRDKGARGEREVAILFRQWLGDDWTVRRLRTMDQSDTGDLVILPPDGHPPFPFAVEVKTSASINLASLLWDPCALWRSWWTQACKQAEKGGKAPLLVFKRDRSPWLVAMWRWDDPADALRPVCHVEPTHVVASVRPLSALLALDPACLLEVGPCPRSTPRVFWRWGRD